MRAAPVCHNVHLQRTGRRAGRRGTAPASTPRNTAHPVEAHPDVGRLWREELLARLGRHARVEGLQDGDAKGRRALACHGSNVGGKVVLFERPGRSGVDGPRREPARLAVVPVVCEEHLWANQEDAPVEAEDTAIVPHPAVQDRHANVAHDAVCSGCASV